MEKNLPVLGGFMIAMGALETSLGVFMTMMTAMGCGLGGLMDLGVVPTNPGDPPGLIIGCMMTVFYGPVAFLNLALGLTRMYAGTLHMAGRGATQGWISCIGGMIIGTMCGCGMFAMLVSVFQLIMYLNPDVKVALAEGDLGIRRGVP
jgi:hypothetical protein